MQENDKARERRVEMVMDNCEVVTDELLLSYHKTILRLYISKIDQTALFFSFFSLHFEIAFTNLDNTQLKTSCLQKVKIFLKASDKDPSTKVHTEQKINVRKGVT